MASEVIASETALGVSMKSGVVAVAVAIGAVGLGGGILEKLAGIARSVRKCCGGHLSTCRPYPDGDCEVACC